MHHCCTLRDVCIVCFVSALLIFPIPCAQFTTELLIYYRAQVHESDVCFVSAHLAAHDGHAEERNKQVY